MDRGIPLSGGLTRRRVLQAGGAAVLAAAGAGVLRIGAATPAGTATAGLTRSAFAPHVGSVFHLGDPGGAAVRARLVAVEDLRGAPRGAEGAFALLFHGPRAPRLPQTMATIGHPVLGRTGALLMSPAGTGARGQDYAIIVNNPSPQDHEDQL